MPAKRHPSSNSGRTRTDWQQAFQFYAALPPEQRDYRSVAAEFGVSVRTVERHGLRQRWRERAHVIDLEAAHTAAQELAKERAAKLIDVDRLIDASHLSYAQQLRDGRVRLSASDLPRLHKLRKELWQEPELAPAPPPLPDTDTDPADRFQHRLQVLKALHEAGALERLQDLTEKPRESEATP
jgi:hypothetical protein